MGPQIGTASIGRHFPSPHELTATRNYPVTLQGGCAFLLARRQGLLSRLSCIHSLRPQPGARLVLQRPLVPTVPRLYPEPGRLVRCCSSSNSDVDSIHSSSPHCRLANFKANHEHKDSFEIVFLSSDEDEAAFAEYFAEMKGFHAVPFADRDAKVSVLSPRCVYDVHSIMTGAPIKAVQGPRHPDSCVR